MEISNDSIVVNEDLRGNGIGTKIMLNQIKEAKNKGFFMLTMYAIGGDDKSESNDYTGYFHWAKYGYEMFPDYQSRFEREWAKKFNVNSLRELAQDSSKYKHWQKEGYSWAGVFYLNDTTTISFFKVYIETQIKKGFNYELWPEVFE